MVKIEKLDNMGRGIAYINNKITFIENALPSEEVEVNITKINNKYQEGIVSKYINKSKDRIEPICPYYDKCGGCKLLHINYEDSLLFKKKKVEDILNKFANINRTIDIIPSKYPLNYRNKITLKVVNGKYGYYENKSHILVEIDNCYLVSKSINRFIKDIKYLNINNGEVIIRSNYNDELLIIIKTKDNIKIDIDYLKSKHKIVGIVVNDKKYYNDDFYLEIINKKIYRISYDSFFQVNRYVASDILNIISKYVNKEDVVLDLYSGVGAIGIAIADKVNKVYGIEIIKNAVINATYNSKINKVIVDPPRAGLDKNTKDYLLNNDDIDSIIYVSCNPVTLARDIKELAINYEVSNITAADMFPYTEHCESITVLERR